MSLHVQRARIEAWAQATGTSLVAVVEDAGISGSRPLAERPGGSRIVNLLDQREPEVDVVVIAKLDRLGRNPSDVLAYLQRFTNGKVGLVSITDRLDLSTPQGRAMCGVLAVFSGLERELIGQRTREALAHLQSQGRAYGPTPYGFRRDGDLLKADEEEQRVIRDILDFRASRCSYREIAAWLNAKDIPAKRGGGWSAMSVRSVCLSAARREELQAVSSI